jgi:hypothetical protein
MRGETGTFLTREVPVKLLALRPAHMVQHGWQMVSQLTAFSRPFQFYFSHTSKYLNLRDQPVGQPIGYST